MLDIKKLELELIRKVEYLNGFEFYSVSKYQIKSFINQDLFNKANQLRNQLIHRNHILSSQIEQKTRVLSRLNKIIKIISNHSTNIIVKRKTTVIKQQYERHQPIVIPGFKII